MSKKVTGLRMLHAAKLTIEDDKVTFETPFRIPDAEEVTITDTFAEGQNYADNVRNIYVKKLTGADITINVSSLSRKLEADITGKAFAKGEMLAKNSDIQPQIAILYQKTYDDGSYDNIVYYNCKLDKTDESSKTSTDNIEFFGVGLTGKATPLPTGEVKYVISSDEVGPDDSEMKGKLDNFFETVQKYGTTE